MKNIFLIACIFFAGAACKKDIKIYRDISGTWRLITVYDKVGNGTVEVAKPAGVTADILLNLDEQKSYSAQTFTRTYHRTAYSVINNNEVEFTLPEFSGGSEKDEWGFAFSVMLTACDLQSIHPCVRNTIAIDNNRLTINTALRYNLVFERVQ